MGMYFIPGNISMSERNRRPNVFPLTLGLHGSNFVDIIGVVKSRLAVLDRGIIAKIKGEEVILYAAI